ncbi:hypothetical protein [Pengzhenrongella frigida]|uniref:hypothetical protein n=1 Tax=Pengzhenrongella frigida TaxID=1259133 RepID=UPI0013EDF8BE|nr:hypothetical protein [Cellulomonas sp. HLT2-17]
MRDPAGVVALAAAVLWIAYLVPHRLRHRQQLLESRAEDRFSGALRVLAVTGRPGRDPRVSEARTDCGTSVERRSSLLTPCRGIPVQNLGVVAVTEGRIVDRPHGTQDRISADAARRAAQRRAHRAASLARRGAAARRRGVLTLSLLVMSVAGWVVVGLTAVAVVAAIAPTVALTGVLVLGRRAVVQGQVADAAWERQRSATGGAARAANAPVTGRALHPSDAPTQVIARIRDDATAPADDAEAGGSAGAVASAPVADADGGSTEAAAPESEPAGWSPVPVPRPTYTTKAAAPRREPIPLVISEPEMPAASAAQPTQDLAEPAAAADGDVAASQVTDAVAPPLAPESAPLDLDAILARRRAAG